ncbi:hypothetical protein BKA69DRAFT_925744 [Paraphysoderma sedebokerense]|nr:hypothetical protein BKA69DRAFT_925744 [Paraphysoderma sedebokerense]
MKLKQKNRLDVKIVGIELCTRNELKEVCLWFLFFYSSLVFSSILVLVLGLGLDWVNYECGEYWTNFCFPLSSVTVVVLVVQFECM